MSRWTTRAVILVCLVVAVRVVPSIVVPNAGPVVHAAAMPTPAEAKTIFYALLKQRTAAVENSDYSLIEPLYAHDERLVVFRPDLALRGWKAVQAYWQKSLSRRRTEPFRVYWNEDLAVTLEADLIVGGLTWSNQAGQNPRNYGCLSLALRRQGDRWVIVHEHSSNWKKPSS